MESTVVDVLEQAAGNDPIAQVFASHIKRTNEIMEESRKKTETLSIVAVTRVQQNLAVHDRIYEWALNNLGVKIPLSPEPTTPVPITPIKEST